MTKRAFTLFALALLNNLIIAQESSPSNEFIWDVTSQTVNKALPNDINFSLIIDNIPEDMKSSKMELIVWDRKNEFKIEKNIRINFHVKSANLQAKRILWEERHSFKEV